MAYAIPPQPHPWETEPMGWEQTWAQPEDGGNQGKSVTLAMGWGR